MKEFGGKAVQDHADGSWTCTVRDPRDVKRAWQMQQGIRDVDVERGYDVHAKSAKEKVVRRDGRVVELPHETIEQAKGRLRPVGRNGVSSALFYGMSDATKRYTKGPAGLYFVWNDGWEPTNLWAPANPDERQPDPDGNVWVRGDDGDWRLED